MHCQRIGGYSRGASTAARRAAFAAALLCPSLAFANGSAFQAIYVLSWSALAGASIAVLLLFASSSLSLRRKLLWLVPVIGAGFGAGIVCLFVFGFIYAGFIDWQINQERAKFARHPVVVSACAGDASALNKALTPQVIDGHSLVLLQVFKECVADPLVVAKLGPTMSGATVWSHPMHQTRQPQEPPAQKLVLEHRRGVLAPLMQAMRSRELNGTSMWRSAFGGGEYCLTLEMIHRANDATIVDELASLGLPLECMGEARVWWVGIAALPDRPSQTISWLLALQRHGVNLVSRGRPVYPEHQVERGVLVDNTQCSSPRVLELLILAGNDPLEALGTLSTDASRQADVVSPKDRWYRRRTSNQRLGCAQGSEALGGDLDAVARVDLLMGVDLPRPTPPEPPFQYRKQPDAAQPPATIPQCNDGLRVASSEGVKCLKRN